MLLLIAYLSVTPCAAQSESAPRDSVDLALEVLREVMEGIREAYVEPVSVDFLLQSALDGLHDRLDPHTKVLSADEYRALRSRQGEAVGVGLTLSCRGLRHPVVQEVMPGSPAERAGLLPGDRLLAVEGESLAEADLETVLAHLRGPLGSSVRLEVAPPAGVARLVELQRDTVTRPAVTTCLMHDGRIGYIEIRRFARGVAERVEACLEDWSDLGLDAIVIDLRDNPGGFIDEAARTADLFLPVGAGIVRTTGRLAEENGVILAHRIPWPACPPLAVLVDSLTASSAEIFAGALKGQPGVRLAGEATYGKRSVQRLKPLPSGGALKITASFYCTPADPEFDEFARGGSAPRPLARMGGAEPRIGERGRPIEPDRLVARLDPDDPSEVLKQAGLLQRFMAETSLVPEDLQGSDLWAGDPPAVRSGRWEAAPGFAGWRARLQERLHAWGCAATVDDSPALRRIWRLDWARERWGADVARRIELEQDPWIEAALEGVTGLQAAAVPVPRSAVQRATPAR